MRSVSRIVGMAACLLVLCALLLLAPRMSLADPSAPLAPGGSSGVGGPSPRASGLSPEAGPSASPRIPASPGSVPGSAPSSAPAVESPPPGSTAAPSPASPDAVSSSAPSPVPAVESPPPGTTAVPSPPPANVATVLLEGNPCLELHARTDLSASERVLIVQRRLEEVLAQATEVPDVRVEMREGRPVLKSGDVYLITVTTHDAELVGRSKAETALLWRASLERGLVGAWRLRSGEYFRGAARTCLLLLCIGIVVHVLIRWAVWRFFNLPGTVPQMLMWLVLVVGMLWQFPSTRTLGTWIENNLALPLVRVVVILTLGFLAWLVSTAYLRRFFRVLGEMRGGEGGARSRTGQRLEMARQVAQVVANTVIFILVGMGLLGAFHINPTSLLASAGLLGVALGVATQDPAKDLTNGIAVLLEDQYGVGDQIKTAGVEGRVVGFTLRSTQVRTAEGSLVTLPNSMVRGVENQSNEWAQVDFRTTIRYDRADIPRAVALMEQAALELREAHPETVLDHPTMLGLDELTNEGAVLRMWLKTAPYKQPEVRRMLLARVAELLDEAGIEFPVGRRKPRPDEP